MQREKKHSLTYSHCQIFIHIMVMALFQEQVHIYNKNESFIIMTNVLTNAIQLTNSIFPLIILPLATIGNSLCFFVFCRPKFQKRLTRTSSICLRLLCINDLILLYLFIIDVLLRIYMKPSMRIYSTPVTCRLYKCIRYSMLDFSAYLQLGLTTDRFICCVYHTYYSHWRKRNYLYYLLAIAFLCIFIKNSSFLSPSYGYYSIIIKIVQLLNVQLKLKQSILQCIWHMDNH